MVGIKAPLTVSFQITGKCNLNCLYCYAWPHTNKIVPKEKVLTIIEQLIDYEVFEIIFEGGEPFMHPDFIDILKTCADWGLEQIGIATNGTILMDNIK